MSEARRTHATITFDGADISDDIENYLLSIVYTDNEEDEADDLQIKLHDRDEIWISEWLEAALNASATNPSASPAPAAEAPSSSIYTVNAKSGLILRDGPSTSNKRLNAFAFGTEVTVNDASSSWYQVTVAGQSGYMYGQYLTQKAGSASSGASQGSSGGGDASSYPTVRFGSQGDYVKLMQGLLQQAGQSLPKYGVDGYFGSETQAAVKGFQGSAGLSVDGICGPLTWAALLNAVNGTGTAQKKSGFVITAQINRENWDDGFSDDLDCGQFELDAVTYQGPPNTITFKATSLPFSPQVRQTKKTKAWENYSLSRIASEMASANGMTCMFEAQTDIQYQRVEQSETADIAFLSELCHRAGLSLKITNNIIVIFDQIAYESSDSVLTIERGDGTYMKPKLSTGQADVQYASCRVSYTTPQGQLIEGIAKVDDYDAESDTNQQLEIHAKVADIGEAQSLAVKYLRFHNKFQKSAQFTFPGNPDLVAGCCVDLEDWGAFSGKYIIKQSKHQLSASGYTTTITLRKVLGGY